MSPVATLNGLAPHGEMGNVGYTVAMSQLLDAATLAPAEIQPTENTSGAKVKSIRGFGSPYLRGAIWWIRYYNGGKEIRESSKSRRLLDAERLLKARWKQIGRGRFIGPREEKVLGNDLFDAVTTNYQQNGRRSLKSVKGRLVPLRERFGTWRVVDITGAEIERYKADRLASMTRRGTPLAVATLNRELAALKRAFRLGIEQERIANAPVVKLLAEHNRREGFVEPGTFALIVSHLPDPIDDIASLAYTTAWRVGEVVSLEWSDVDLTTRRIRLRSQNSKAEEPRVIVLTGELLALMQRRWDARKYKTKEHEGLSEFVFHRRGRRIVDFRKRWVAACAEAKVPGLLFHDLRRSGVRNMDKAGVSQAVAMKISGHKTDSIYRRYRIVDEDDIEKALTVTQEATKQAPPTNVTAIDAARAKGK